MGRESSRFSQQAINRIAEIAIASQLKQDVEISVDIKTTLKQLTKGQIDAIVILIRRLVLSYSLRTETFQLDIGAVTVKPLSAVKGQIKLLHSSQGTLRVVIDENDLTAALNESIQRNAAPGFQQAGQTKFLRCLLANGVITVQQESNSLSAETGLQTESKTESIALRAVPSSEPESKQRILWQPASEQPNAGWISEVIDSLDRLLNLKDFEQKGLLLTVREIQIADGRLQLNANALIQQFPSDAA